MITFKSKYGLETPVHFKVGKETIRWASITAVKFDLDSSIRYDLIIQGQRFYDILEQYLIDANKESEDTILNSGYLT